MATVNLSCTYTETTYTTYGRFECYGPFVEQGPCESSQVFGYSGNCNSGESLTSCARRRCESECPHGCCGSGTVRRPTGEEQRTLSGSAVYQNIQYFVGTVYTCTLNNSTLTAVRGATKISSNSFRVDSTSFVLRFSISGRCSDSRDVSLSAIQKQNQVITVSGSDFTIVGVALLLSAQSNSGLSNFSFSCSSSEVSIIGNQFIATKCGIFQVVISEPGNTYWNPVSVSIPIIVSIDNLSPVLVTSSGGVILFNVETYFSFVLEFLYLLIQARARKCSGYSCL